MRLITTPVMYMKELTSSTIIYGNAVRSMRRLLGLVRLPLVWYLMRFRLKVHTITKMSRGRLENSHVFSIVTFVWNNGWLGITLMTPTSPPTYEEFRTITVKILMLCRVTTTHYRLSTIVVLLSDFSSRKRAYCRQLIR